MKEVIKGKELKNKMKEAINLLCDTVGSTLGPSGNNVIINSSDMSPYITNDGVTIATEIESNDKVINTILNIAKEASLNTNELVGDGTTTTLVLLQAIFIEGLKEIEKGTNPIALKKELLVGLDKIIKKLEYKKIMPNKNNLTAIAKTSINDDELGNLVSEVFDKMKSKYSIMLEDSNSEKTYYEIKKGYTLEIDNISSIYFKDKNILKLNDVNLLALNGYLDNLEEIADIINDSMNTNLIILVDDYDEIVKEEIISYYLHYHKNIFLFKIPDYGSRKEEIVNDICVISNSNLKSIDDEIKFSDLGKVESITITKDEIIFISNNDITFYKDKLKCQLENTKSTYEREFISNRLSKLENGVATIYVGGITSVEKKEKKMRIEDALNAIDLALSGVIIGEGIPLLEISQTFKSDSIGEEILKKSLEIPFYKIMENVGENTQLRKQEIINNNYKKIFNLNKLESIKTTNILDPISVTITALKNATSIAAMLLTTNYLVINDNIELQNEM